MYPGPINRLMIQDPLIIADIDFSKYERAFRNIKLRPDDSFTLEAVGGWDDQKVGILGSSRHAYLHWFELRMERGDLSPESEPEWQESMHVAAELGREVEVVHGEICWHRDRHMRMHAMQTGVQQGVGGYWVG